MIAKQPRVYAPVAYLFVLASALVIAGLSMNLVVSQPITRLALLAAGLALVSSIPGLVKDGLWPVSLLLGLGGLYLLWRLAMPLPHSELGTGMNFLEQHVYYGQVLRLGVASYQQDVYPLTLEDAPGLQLLVLTVWYGMAWIGAFLGVALRRPLLGMGILGAVIGTACNINNERQGVWLAVGFLVLFGASLALTRSGSPRQAPARFGPHSAVLGLGIAGFAAFASLGLLAAAPTLAVQGLPQLSAWDPFHQATGPEIVFNWRQNYPQLLDPGRNYPIMKVTSPVPAYWRANVLDVFTGESWVSRGSFLTPVGDVEPQRVVPRSEEAAPGKAVTQTFEIDGVHTAYLFTGGYPTQLGLVEPTRIFSSSAMALKAERSLGPRITYTLSVIVPQVHPEDLVGLGREYSEALQEKYLGIPIPTAAEAREAGGVDDEWIDQVRLTSRWIEEYWEIYALNDRMVGDAEDPYQVALRIEQYLRAHYQYTLHPPKSELRSPYAAFLLDTHKGFCQHFAGAMALMLRLNGIPSRVAVGFVTGDEISDNVYQVMTNNAHAWVEAYFPGHGWLSLDPTPGRGMDYPGASSASAGFVDPYPEQPTTTTTTIAADGTVPSYTARPPEDGFPIGQKGTTGLGNRGKMSPVSAALLALLGVAVVWPAGLALKRDLPTRFGPPERRLRATARRLISDLDAWGLAPSPSSTLDEVAEMVESRVGVDVRPMVERAQEVAFGGGTAGEWDVRDARNRAARVRRRLRTIRGWSRTIRAWYGIPVPQQSAASRAAGERWRNELKRRRAVP